MRVTPTQLTRAEWQSQLTRARGLVVHLEILPLVQTDTLEGCQDRILARHDLHDTEDNCPFELARQV
jgi:hypothetical protein